MTMWNERDNKLVRQFEFKNFRQAFSFMTEVAMWAERFDHHPDWKNSYNTVTITLTTHSEGGKVTDTDRQMAEKIDETYARFQ